MKLDRIEMLHFRLSPVLEKLFQTSRTRPLSDIVRRRGTTTTYPHVQLSSQLKTLRPLSHASPPWRRTLCTKTEGAIEPSEQVKKDEIIQEGAADK